MFVCASGDVTEHLLRDGSIVFSIVVFSVNTITDELLHLSRRNSACICSLTTCWSILKVKVIGQRSRSQPV